ncbi:PREDICTED: uncharacterized protein LOC109353944 [Lupinus angustifolius]|uniref:uncharacterized protein LOC109353944 n=1 Tax=Lupinus angustifolius TaxID=3871 RepID=UPI00092EB9ED|nr:PREDICTED: uncharacterized protein LOC109353944 [Lupinus angustifolius]
MQSEFDGLISNKTWELVLQPCNVNIVHFYMHQPMGFHDPHHLDYVCRLKKSLYGLKQAPRSSYQRFAEYVSSIGFQHNTSNLSLFIYQHGDALSYILLYVDDIILIISSHDLRKSIMALLASEFAMKDFGPLSYFLGITVIIHACGLFLNQSTYASEIIARASMDSYKPSATPVDAKHKLIITSYGTPYEDPTMYQSLYIALWLASLSTPTEKLVSYTNADWRGCPNTRRSTSTYCVFLRDNLISWSSKRQPTLSRSSAEAEYMCVANVVSESCWLNNLILELHFPLPQTTLVYCDNVSVIYLSGNLVQH